MRFTLRRVDAALLEAALSWFVVLVLVIGSPSAVPPAPLANQLPETLHCSAVVQVVDHGRVSEEVRQALDWNRLLADSTLVSLERGGYYTLDEVLAKVDGWTPTTACLAQAVGIPPELLAGLLATELYMDYNAVDVLVDGVIRSESVIGDMLCYVVRGGGYASVHVDHLKRALQALGPDLSPSPFYRSYYRLLSTLELPDITRLATRNLLIDLMDAAVMARYYADLRLGRRQMAGMTIEDMAFVWSAYRGGVVGTPADPRPDSRWSLEYLQQASDPHLFGDTLVALPFFSYYHDVFRNAYSRLIPPTAANPLQSFRFGSNNGG
jgi:hypothetical protein